MHTPEVINEVMHRRRSIYPYQYEPGASVDDGIVRQILENANTAPNHKKTMPWRFTVFNGDGRKKFAELQSSLYIKHHGTQNQVKIKKLEDYPLMASHIIAIGLKRHADRLPEIEEVLAVGCAIQNMFLTATAYNLGCYLSTGGVTYIDEAKAYFHLEPEDKLIGFFYIGKIKDAPKEMLRTPVDEKITFIS